MLYQKRINKIIGDIDKFFDTIDQALLIFGEGVKNYLYTNVEAFKGNLQTMTRLENEAELLRREIEAGLYRQSSLVRLRGDIMRLLEALDHIIDTLNDNLFQFEIERPFIPVELNADFLKLTELSTQAVETAIPAARPISGLRTVSPRRFTGSISTKRRRTSRPNPSRRRFSTRWTN